MGFMDDLKKLAKPYAEDDDDFDEFDDDVRPSRRSSPRAKKKRPARRRKHKQDATTKGVVFSITRPAEKGKGFHL